jgi:hypothetical protein
MKVFMNFDGQLSLHWHDQVLINSNIDYLNIVWQYEEAPKAKTI